MAEPFTPAQIAVVHTMISEAIDVAMSRRNVGRYTTGVIKDVTGADAQVEPDDAPGTLSPATVTNASDQTIGQRVLVWSGGPGASYLIGVIP